MPERLGQHFLIDPSVSQKIIAALAPAPNDTVIEIGPGRGALTLPLAERLAQLPEARLIAIERDSALAAEVRETLGTKGLAADIVDGDARTVLPALAGTQGAYLLTGNLPYYLTGFFFRLLSELTLKPIRAVFMVQREVAERMAATPPRMNLLAATLQHWTAVSLVATVPVSAFSPRPRVEGAIILLTPRRRKTEIPLYYTLVRALFKQPRKTIHNNLIAAAPNLGIAGNGVDRALEGAGIIPGNRPHTLSLEAIERLAARLSPHA